jgi:hypothetical protein
MKQLNKCNLIYLIPELRFKTSFISVSLIEHENNSHVLTHSPMELSPSWEAVNCAAIQEIPSILENP